MTRRVWALTAAGMLLVAGVNLTRYARGAATVYLVSGLLAAAVAGLHGVTYLRERRRERDR